MNALILLVHLVGLALALGGAAVKISLLLGCRAEPDRIGAYLRVAPAVTRLLLGGLVVLTASGIAWLAIGRPLTPGLLLKMGLVAGLWGLGPIIDKVVEPAFLRHARAVAGGERAGPQLDRARRRYLAVEVLATTLLGVIAVLGVLV